MARQYYEDSTTGQMKPLGVKVEDTLPVGTIVEYNGQNIPEGWVDIGSGKIEKQYQVIPTNAKLENGDSTSATNGYTANYINNHSVVVSPIEPNGNARKKVWKQHGTNVDDKEYILNDNDVYEEFKPQNEVYSTSETRIGTWIDGKPIYRKVFTGTLANDANSYNIGTITDIDNEVNSYGRTIVGGTTSYYTPLNIYLDSNFRSLVQITTTTGQIVVTYGNTFKGCAFEYVIEYTKTTN